MGKLQLTFACWEYDRTRALADGSVVPEGIDLNCLTLHVEETAVAGETLSVVYSGDTLVDPTTDDVVVRPGNVV